MKFTVASLIAAAAWTPLVAGQYSCHCQVNDGKAPPIIVANIPCQRVGGTLCHNAAGNYNVCKTNKPWTVKDCKDWTGSPEFPDSWYRAVCNSSGGGCSS